MDNKDSAWKEAIETYFPDFIKFFFPNIAKDIDFEKGYEFLNKELERIVQDAEIGKRLSMSAFVSISFRWAITMTAK